MGLVWMCKGVNVVGEEVSEGVVNGGEVDWECGEWCVGKVMVGMEVGAVMLLLWETV